MAQMLLNHSRRFGEFLVERHVLSRDALEAALDEEAASGTALPALLVERGAVSGKDLAAAMAHGAGLRFVDLSEAPLHPEAATAIPAEVARRRQALGVGFDGPRLVVALADPWDEEALAEVAAAAGSEVDPAVAERGELALAIESVYAPAGDGATGRVVVGREMPRLVETGEPPLHLNDCLERVVELGGSDLHLTAGAHPMVRVHGAGTSTRSIPDRRKLAALAHQADRAGSWSVG
jgi:hypothetical protein